MKTDKELLELAEKAARSATKDILTIGCPLDDSGDALRLAVELNLRIEHEKHSVYVGYSGDDGADICAESVCASISRGRATRRAIVRAAAAIGERL